MTSKFVAHQGLVQDLSGVADSSFGDVSDHLKTYQGGVQLLGGKASPLVDFSTQGVLLGNSKLLLPLQIQQLQADRSFSVSQILSMLDTDDISLNHLGIRYQVDDIDAEVKRIQQKMQNDMYKVFEDEKGQKENMRWLFVGAEDTQNPGKPCVDTPMMEIVLPHRDESIPPHFQFDVDTPLSQQQIDQRIDSGTRLPQNEGFFTWSLDISGIGKVLSMGPYYNMHGINHEIGIGNNKRSKEDHRNSMIMIT